jgi:hypothetical protein
VLDGENFTDALFFFFGKCRLDLLKNKSQPEAAANNAAGWVISEREMRERLRREQDAREAKERQDVGAHHMLRRGR